MTSTTTTTGRSDNDGWDGNDEERRKRISIPSGASDDENEISNKCKKEGSIASSSLTTVSSSTTAAAAVRKAKRRSFIGSIGGWLRGAHSSSSSNLTNAANNGNDSSSSSSSSNKRKSWRGRRNSVNAFRSDRIPQQRTNLLDQAFRWRDTTETNLLKNLWTRHECSNAEQEKQPALREMMVLLPKVTEQVLTNGNNTQTRSSTRDYSVCNGILLYMFEKGFEMEDSSTIIVPKDQSLSGVELFTTEVCDCFSKCVAKILGEVDFVAHGDRRNDTVEKNNLKAALHEVFGDAQECFAILALDVLLILAEKNSNLTCMADSRIPMLLLRCMRTIMCLEDEKKTGLKAERLLSFQERASSLLCLSVHNESMQTYMRRCEGYTFLYLLIMQDQGDVASKELLLAVTEEVSKSFDEHFVSYLSEKQVIKAIVSAMASFEIAHHISIAIAVKFICSLLRQSCEHSEILVNDFSAADGYNIMLKKLTGCTEGFETDEKVMNQALQSCASLVFIGGNDPVINESVVSSFVSCPPQLGKSGDRVRNLDAFQVFCDMLLQTHSVKVQLLIIENLLFIFASDRTNYIIVHHLHNLSLFIRRLIDMDKQVQCLVLKLVEFVVTSLNVVPFEEFCGMVTLLQSASISPSLAIDVLNTMLKIMRFDESYKDHFREAKLFEVLIAQFTNQFSDILARDAKSDNDNDSHDRLVSTAATTLITMLENSAANMKYFRDVDGMTTLQQLLVESDVYRDWSLRIFSAIIIQNTFQHQFDVTLLIEVLQSSPRSNVQLKLGIFEALKKMLLSNDRAKDAFRETGFVATISVLINMQWPSPSQSSRMSITEDKQQYAASVDKGYAHEDDESTVQTEFLTDKEKEHLQLFESMFQTLTCAMHNHYINKSMFCSLIGEAAIVDALKINGVMQTRHSARIYQSLFDFATERTIHVTSPDEEICIGKFAVPTRSHIVNSFAISFTLDLLEYVSGLPVQDRENNDAESIYLEVVNVLEYMMDISLANVQSLSEIGIVHKLLLKFNNAQGIDLECPLHQKLLRLLERVATFRMTPEEVRLFLQFLKPKDLPRSLLNMIIRITRNGSSVPYIEMREKSECSIVGLEEGRTWPVSTSYTFACWFYLHGTHRIQSTRTQSTEFILLQIESSDNKSFLKIAIKESTGFAEIQVNAKSKPNAFSAFSFSPNQWYHVVFVHQKQRLQTSLCTMYVNGRQEDSQRISFVGSANMNIAKFSGCVGRCNAMSPHGVPPPSPNASYEKRSQYGDNDDDGIYVWKLGQAMLVDDALGSKVISSIYAAGPSYKGYFQGDYMQTVSALSDYISSDNLRMLENSRTLNKIRDAPDSDIQKLTRIKRKKVNADKIVFVFHASVCCVVMQETRNDICMRNVVQSNDCCNAKPYALLRGYAAICTPRSLSDNMHHVDGIIVVLAMVERADTSELLEASLELLDALLRGCHTSRIHNELDRVNGYQLISIMMRRKSHLIKPRVLSIMWNMCIAGSTPERDIITNMRVCTRWLLDYEIWKRAPLELQCDIFERFCSIVRSPQWGKLNILRLKHANVISILLHMIKDVPPLEVLSHIAQFIRALIEEHTTVDDIASLTDFLLISQSGTYLMDDFDNDNTKFASEMARLTAHFRNEMQSTDTDSTLDSRPSFQRQNINSDDSSGSRNNSSSHLIPRAAVTPLAKRNHSSLSVTLTVIAARNLILKNLIEVLNENRTLGESNSAIDLLVKVVDIKWFNLFLQRRTYPITVILIVQLLCVLIDANALKDDRLYLLLSQGLVSYCNQPDIYYSLMCIIVGKKINFNDPEKENFTGICDFAREKQSQLVESNPVAPYREISTHFPKVMNIILCLLRQNNNLSLRQAQFEPVSVFRYFKNFFKHEYSFQAKRRWMLLRHVILGASAISQARLKPPESVTKKGITSTKKNISPQRRPGQKHGQRSLNVSLFDTIMTLVMQIPEFMTECKKQDFIEGIIGIVFVNANRHHTALGSALELPRFHSNSSSNAIDSSSGATTVHETRDHRDIRTLPRSFKHKLRLGGSESDLMPGSDMAFGPRMPSKEEMSFLLTEPSSKVLQLINMLLLHEFTSVAKTRLLEDILQTSSAKATDIQNNSFRTRVLSNLIHAFVTNDSSRLEECSHNVKLMHNLAQFSSQVVEFYLIGLFHSSSYHCSVDFLAALCQRLEKIDAAKKKTLYLNTTFGSAASALSTSKETPLSVAFSSLNRFLVLRLSPLKPITSQNDQTAEVLRNMVEKDWFLTALNPINKDREFWSCLCYLLFILMGFADKSDVREAALVCWKLMIASELYPLLSSIMTFKVPGGEKTNTTVNISEGFRSLLDKDMNTFMSWFILEIEKISCYFEDNLHPILKNFKSNESKNSHGIILNFQSKARSRRNSLAQADRRGVEHFYALQNDCSLDMSTIRENEINKHNTRAQQDLIRTRIAWDRWKMLRKTLYREHAVWANVSLRELLHKQEKGAEEESTLFVSWKLNMTEGPTRMRKRIELVVSDSKDPFHDIKYLASPQEDHIVPEDKSDMDSSIVHNGNREDVTVPMVNPHDEVNASPAIALVPSLDDAGMHRRIHSTDRLDDTDRRAQHTRSSSATLSLNLSHQEDTNRSYIIDQLKKLEELQMSPGRIRSPSVSPLRSTRQQGMRRLTMPDSMRSNANNGIDKMYEDSPSTSHAGSSTSDAGDQSNTDLDDYSMGLTTRETYTDDFDIADTEEEIGREEETEDGDGHGENDDNADDDDVDDDDDDDYTERLDSLVQGDDIVREELEEREMMMGEAAGEDFKIKKLLEPGDSITHRYNCMRIAGLDGQRAIMLIGIRNLYIVDNYSITANGDIVEIHDEQINMSDLPMDALGERMASSATTMSSHIDHNCIKISLSEGLVEVQTRRYLLTTTALEFFCRNGCTYFVVFLRNEVRKVYNFLTSRHKLRNSTTMANRQKMTTLWQRGDVSNFEYLMYLNTCAGRSYADLTQYPVFPWILSDYSSPVLDLSNLASFRDLSKPMGALTETRRKNFEQRFKEWDDKDSGIPKFHYGTHYSSAAIVLHYLMRLEPFTSQNIELQGGRFDLPDRLFHNIHETWLSASDDNSMSDVKELIPEFFYLPEFLVNQSKVHFGKRQMGTVVDNVQLPVWANGDPLEFIRLNRKALESDYVSEHLNEWIDLVFGYKQTGKEAIAATNMFFHLTYEGAVDVDTIDDEMEKQATISQIMNFGQTPHQLFKKAHPKRIARQRNTINTPSERLRIYANMDDLVFTLEKSMDAANPTSRSPYELPGGGKTKSTRDYLAFLGRTLVPLGQNSVPMPVGQIHTTSQGNLIALPYRCILIRPKNTKYLSWHLADNSLRIYSVPGSNFTLQAALFQGNQQDAHYVWEDLHWDAKITCADMTDDGKMLVLGGDDSMVSVWRMHKKRSGSKTQLQLHARLCGHCKAITCLAVSDRFNVIVSGSDDATCIVWDLNNLDFVCELQPISGRRHSISTITINEQSGDIIVSSWTHVFVYTINGRPLASIDTGRSSITALCLVYTPEIVPMEEGMIVTGHDNGAIKMLKFDHDQPREPIRTADAEQQEPADAWSETSQKISLTHPDTCATGMRDFMQHHWKRIPLRIVADKRDVNVARVTALSVSRDCKKLFVGDCHGNVFSLAVDPSRTKQLTMSSSPSATTPHTPPPSTSQLYRSTTPSPPSTISQRKRRNATINASNEHFDSQASS